METNEPIKKTKSEGETLMDEILNREPKVGKDRTVCDVLKYEYTATCNILNWVLYGEKKPKKVDQESGGNLNGQ